MRVLTITLACVVAGIGSADEPPKFDPNSFANNQPPCLNTACPKGTSIPIPKKSLEFTSTGCSSIGGGLILEPGKAGGIAEAAIYEECCHLFHACLQICGMSKKHCDESLKQCTDKKCAGDSECQQAASVLSIMTQLTGCPKYQQAQTEHCQCVAKDSNKVDAKRRDVIAAFYEKFGSKSSVDDSRIDSLAAKADTPAKLAGLLEKLIAKFYPNTIQVKADPKQEDLKKLYKEMDENSPDKDDEEHIEL